MIMSRIGWYLSGTLDVMSNPGRKSGFVGNEERTRADMSPSYRQRKRRYCFPILCSILLLIGSQIHAAIVPAASCSFADVHAAVSRAHSGDTVTIPSGSATWSSGLTLPTGVILKGTGMSMTLITAQGIEDLVKINGQGSRVTGIGFFQGDVVAEGHGWRVDRCRFTFVANMGVCIFVRSTQANDSSSGLIDHCEMINSRILVIGYLGLADHFAWHKPLALGTADAVYVEDCVITKESGNGIDSNYGSKYVFRYNTVTGAYLEAHSLQQGRGSRSWEIYQNTITSGGANTWTPFFLRGGTGVVFNNRLEGQWYQPNVTVDNVRSCDASSGYPVANGSAVVDGNEALPQGTGAHTGVNDATTLVDATRNWIPGTFLLSSQGITVYNLTDGSKGIVSSFTSQTITATLSGGARNTWYTGDRYLISDGYPCRDQIGRSTDTWLWTPTTPYPTQAIDPMCVWGNKNTDGSTIGVNVHNCERNRWHIRENRDYYELPRPNYLPYVYPHPLTLDDYPGQNRVLAPRGVRQGEELLLSWQAVSGAVSYRVVIDWAEDQALTTDLVTLRVPIPAGTHNLMVTALDTTGRILAAEGIAVPVAGEIRLLAPNGGEQWRRGETRQITWTASGIAGDVVIELVRNDSVIGTIATVPANQGNFTWTVGRVENGSFISSGNLRIRVRTPNNSAMAEREIR